MINAMGTFHEGIVLNHGESVIVRGHGASRGKTVESLNVKIRREGATTMSNQFDMKKAGSIVLLLIGLGVLISTATQQKTFSTAGGLIISALSLFTAYNFWQDSKADEGRV